MQMAKGEKMNKELAIRILRSVVLGINEQTHEAVFMAIKALKAEPVRHGHWDIIYTDNIPYAYRCSLCGTTRIDNGNYCPHCGAKMDEVEEE